MRLRYDTGLAITFPAKVLFVCRLSQSRKNTTIDYVCTHCSRAHSISAPTHCTFSIGPVSGVRTRFCFAPLRFAKGLCNPNRLRSRDAGSDKTGPIEKEAHDCRRQSWIIFGSYHCNQREKKSRQGEPGTYILTFCFPGFPPPTAREGRGLTRM